MFGDRFSSSTSCSRWLHETEPDRPDPSLTCCFLKVATHPLKGLFTAPVFDRFEVLDALILDSDIELFDENIQLQDASTKRSRVRRTNTQFLLRDTSPRSHCL